MARIVYGVNCIVASIVYRLTISSINTFSPSSSSFFLLFGCALSILDYLCSYGRFFFTDKFISFTNEWVHFVLGCCYRYRSLCMQSQYLSSNDYGLGKSRNDAREMWRMKGCIWWIWNLCMRDLNNKKKRVSGSRKFCIENIQLFLLLKIEKNECAFEHIELNQMLFIIISCLLLLLVERKVFFSS